MQSKDKTIEVIHDVNVNNQLALLTAKFINLKNVRKSEKEFNESIVEINKQIIKISKQVRYLMPD